MAAYGLAALAVVRLLRGLDLAAIRVTLSGARWWVLLALIPFAFQLSLEVVSWRHMFAEMGHSVTWLIAFRVQMGAEAIRLGMPGGSAVAEGLRPVLFKRHAGVPIADGTAALAVRKLVHLGTQGLWLALGAFLGTALFECWAPLLGWARSAVGAMSLAVSAAMIGAAVVLRLILVHGSLASRIARALAHLSDRRNAPPGRQRSTHTLIDLRLRKLLRIPSPVLVTNLATALAGWAMDAAETWLILSGLGLHLSWGEAVALEGCISLIRPVAFLVPGGLGIQDLGYQTLLAGALGAPGALSFVIARRVRDLFWLLAGLGARPL